MDVSGVRAVDHGNKEVQQKEGGRDSEHNEGDQGEERYIRIKVLLRVKAVDGDGKHGVDRLRE